MAQTRLKRFIVATDSHGDMIDAPTEAAYLDFDKHWKADLKIHLGDFMDLRALRKGAGDEEKNEGVQRDIDRGVGFVRDAGFQVLLWGNHDYRLVRALRDGCGRLREHAAALHNAMLDQLEGIQHVPYGKRHGVYRFADVTCLHGYHAGIYAARMAAATYGPGKVVMGHIHSKSVFMMPTLQACEGHSVACLCSLDMEYAIGHANTLRQSNGWAYGVIGKNNQAIIWHAEKVGDDWILPSEFTHERGNETSGGNDGLAPAPGADGSGIHGAGTDGPVVAERDSSAKTSVESPARWEFEIGGVSTD